ncbi:MazG nucleotide pyrophosphohydrolase domain-containing protein [Stackebrandtia soli]|uniref:MazG nucleotide pyrophosphohydrolase domain-containing protein n=1 Tax=Stackebrandtia soli TaxID=1892856 RepID=UPI0039E76C3A
MTADSPAGYLAEFHEAFGIHRESTPTHPPDGIAALCLRVLDEEIAEVSEAVGSGSLADVAHELADVVYAAYGMALAHGIDLDAVLAEVHRANMSKLDAEGKAVRRDDGKVVKSDLFRPADVVAVLRQQIGNTPDA